MKKVHVALALLALASATTSGQAASVCSQWEWISPNPPLVNLTAVIVDGARLVAVGGDHTVLASEGGDHWAVLFSQPGGDFTDVATIGGRLVAAGDGIWDSMDGRTWTRRVPNALGSAFAHNGRELLVLGGEEGVWRSTDGVSWDHLPVPGGSRLARAVWDGRRWVAAGEGVGLSTDGSAWELSLAGVYLSDIAWTGDRYLSVGAFNGAGLFLGSNDALDWTVTTTNDTDWYYTGSLTWNGSQFLVTRNGDRVATSPDGVTWTDHGLPAGVAVARVIWADGRYVSVGPGGTVATSATGASWTRHRAGPTADLQSLAWTGTEFLSTGSEPTGGGALLASRDGSSWRDLLGSGGWGGPQLPALRAAARVFGHIVAVGGGGVIIAGGDDGIFARVDGGVVGATTLLGITVGAAGAVAVGEDGTVVTSSNGVFWERRDALLGTPLYGVVWTGTRYVAVGGRTGYGGSGAAFVSSDGREWASAGVTGGALVAIAAGRPGLVAIQESFDPWMGSYRGQLLFSHDGTIWTAVERLPWWGGYVNVAWTGSTFMLLTAGSLAVSDDGLTWASAGGTIPGLGGLAALAGDGSHVVVAGGSGTILRTVCTAPRVRRHLRRER